MSTFFCYLSLLVLFALLFFVWRVVCCRIVSNVVCINCQKYVSCVTNKHMSERVLGLPFVRFARSSFSLPRFIILPVPSVFAYLCVSLALRETLFLISGSGSHRTTFFLILRVGAEQLWRRVWEPRCTSFRICLQVGMFIALRCDAAFFFPAQSFCASSWFVGPANLSSCCSG